MIHELSFTITQAQQRRVVWQWFWSVNPWSPASALALVASALGLLLSSGGLRVLFALVFGAVACYCALFAHSALRTRASWGEIHLTLDAAGLSWHGEFGESRAPWSALTRLDLCRDYVFVSILGEPVTLPRAALSDEALRFLLQHTSEAGGVVRGATPESGLPADRISS